jgi:hypothetical protein
MTTEELIDALEKEYDRDTGSLGLLRDGIMDLTALSRLQPLLEEAKKHSSNDLLPKRMVSLLWYIPLFMTWQEERVRERAGNDAVEQLKRMTNQTLGMLEEILGAP